MDKNKFKEVTHKLWPSTKKELEKAIASAKKLSKKGEKHLKIISGNSIKNTKKVTLSLKKEQLYYALGKNVAKVVKTKWAKDEKINDLISKIKELDKEIKKLSKK